MQITPQSRVDAYRQKGWWRGVTVDRVFRDAAARYGASEALIDPPNREALIGDAPQRLSYADLDRRVDSMAKAFAHLGVVRDSVVAVQLPNIVEGVIAFLACARLGAILSPLSAAFRHSELRDILPRLKPALFITVDAFHGFNHLEMIEALKEEGVYDGEIALVGAAPRFRLADIERATAEDHGSFPEDLDPAAVLTICWTSGTEASPKGVPRHHDHWVVNGEALQEAAELTENDTLLNPFPLINIAAFGGMVMPWLLSGGRLVQHHPFDLPVFLQQLSSEKVTYTVAPPAILTMLLKNEALLEGVDLGSLRCLASGSAPLPPFMVETWQHKYGVPVMNIFGSNEGCSLFSSHLEVEDPTARAKYFPRFGVDGMAWSTSFPGKIRTRLVDLETGDDITEPGRAGELRIDGAMTFDGYWDDADLSARAFDGEGYFKTGDLFEIADEPSRRYYQFVGRSKEIIIRGGVNISPAEIDALIESHPKVSEAACAGYPDSRLGERVGAVVALKPDETLTLDELTAFMREAQISVYKLPEKLQVVESLPRNALGKVVRRSLADIVQK